MSMPNKCPRCGTQILDGSVFCLHCMYSLRVKNPIHVHIPSKRKIVLAIFSLSIFVLILLAVLFISYFCDTDGNLSDSGKAESLDLCVHVYSPATCSAPQTCSLCGHMEGGLLPEGHNWVNGTEIVRHPEEGHWENVEINRTKELRYLCYFCDYSQEGFASQDVLMEHIKTHNTDAKYEIVISDIDSVTEVREIWVPVYESRWVVDKEAYSESLSVDTCSLCGEKKQDGKG